MNASNDDIAGLLDLLFDGDILGTVQYNQELHCLEAQIFMPRAEYRGPMPTRYRGFPVKYEFGSDYTEKKNERRPN